MKKSSVLKVVKFTLAVTGSVCALNIGLDLLATAKHRLTSSPENFYQWKNGRVYYDKKGNGKPLLLIHDLSPVSSSFEWSKVVNGLSKHHTVYTVDLTGCGRSDKEQLTYVGFFYVQLIESFIQNIIGIKTDIIATSASAGIVLSAYGYDSSFMGKVILVNPVSLSSQRRSHGQNGKMVKVLLECPIIGNLIYNLVFSRPRIDQLFTDRLFYNPFHVSNELVDTYCEAAHLNHGNGRYLLACIDSGYLNVDPTKVLQAAEGRFEIIAGQACESITSTIKEYTDQNSDIGVAWIKNTKKLPQLEEPVLFVKEAEAFLSDS